MRRATVAGRTLGVLSALLMVAQASALEAQTARPGPATTPSGSYLNLQPRRPMPQPPLVAPRPRLASEVGAARDRRRVVCGLTMITPPAAIDVGMAKPVAKDGPRPGMRTVDPPICNPAR